MTDRKHIVHATAIAIDNAGILLLGKSGSGKSDLALRLIDRGAWLVCDDAVEVDVVGNVPQLYPAPNIAGKIEMHGVGIVERTSLPSALLRLIVLLDQNVERMPPDNQSQLLCEFDIPALALNAFEASAPLKVEQRLKTVIDAGLLPVAVERATS